MRDLLNKLGKPLEVKLDGGAMAQPQAPTTQGSPKAGRDAKHDSAHKHVAGAAQYIDDRFPHAGQLYGCVGKSPHAHARVISMNLDKVRAAPGVLCVITADDIPGHLDIGPVFPGDMLLVKDKVEFVGQPLFAVAAESHDAARRAVKLAEVEYEVLPATLTIEDALQQQLFVRPPHQMRLGEPETALANAPNRLRGDIEVGGQEHFYLEGQISLAIPEEDGGMHIFASSQHPSEVQKLVAEVLDVPFNRITVDVRRMGGGFGGKETQAAPWACLAAVLARKSGRPVKFRLSRSDDMEMTGKRHHFHNHFDVGFDDEGRILGADITVNGLCGYSPDLSDAIVDRAMFHADNAYFLANANIIGNRCKTHTVSNTAFRGFGGPQGMMAAEAMIEAIARRVGKDPVEVRLLNYYREDHERYDFKQGGHDVTPYHQKVEQNLIPLMTRKLMADADYHARKAAIRAFNASSPILKKGLALTPVKFGISFTVQHLNQAGALIHIYTDGSIHLNHGGTEMGQGLYTKVAQIVAQEFQVDVDNIVVSAARTDKVPNTSPTAASSGTDLNGKAAQNAAQTIKGRLIEFACEHYQVTPEQVYFADNNVHVGEKAYPFAEFIQQAYMGRVSLSATGFYKTPKIHYDRETASGRPFFYFANGVAASEVIVDTLTGEYKVLRADILHDVGKSLNPAIDIGQIEGGFIQGMGWLTTEEVCWDANGRLLSNSPANYKIPTLGDLPEVLNVELLPNEPNREETIYHSKAVGEPPFMLAISVWCALKDAISSLTDYRIDPPLHTPSTPEKVLAAVEATLSAAKGE
ncbi:xanthine dehydrogenase molybdopterin binding subunit [Hahella aquimaris]|uniref:xanthine dehydrogenase molybdopterin binding subunit n=1 Tax=Hahella sp. HNIBRBA332 TaxID=3015983 RepID=UPI00273AD9B5|nr:xanthine dehydrogenase molybdopterin binding subunit [Hahella sp. HNIBRBA332]WLQ12171.1 xanthine dehydrogenase molybdopterin binding subunit [Hahella sp. HNIBRBA332]